MNTTEESVFTIDKAAESLNSLRTSSGTACTAVVVECFVSRKAPAEVAAAAAAAAAETVLVPPVEDSRRGSPRIFGWRAESVVVLVSVHLGVGSHSRSLNRRRKLAFHHRLCTGRIPALPRLPFRGCPRFSSSPLLEPLSHSQFRNCKQKMR